MSKIAFKNLGCKVNFAEIQKWIDELRHLGMEIVDKDAEVYIINACAVTCKAEKETRQLIHQIKRQKPSAKIILTGCFNSNLSKEVSITVPAIKKDNLINVLLRISKRQLKINYSRKDAFKERTRAFIKIQDGCNNFCSYCIVPYFRGKSRSYKIKDIISLVREKEKQGFKEIVLCGVNLGDFKDGKYDLADLIVEILTKTKLPRIRLSSINPENITDKLLKLFENPRLMPHLHIPLQSGSNKILKLMRRKYTAKDYLKLIKKILKKYPLFGISTDVIIGFPGETDLDFHQTLNLIKQLPFLKIHIFRFSPRQKTLAYFYNLRNSVDEKIKKKRVNILKNLTMKIAKQYRDKFKKMTLPVLFESKKSGVYWGYTPNYLLVKKKSKKDLQNKIIDVCL